MSTMTRAGRGHRIELLLLVRCEECTYLVMRGLLEILHLGADRLHFLSLLLGNGSDYGLLVVRELQRVIEPLHHLCRIHLASTAAPAVTRARSAGRRLVARRRGRGRSGLILGSEYRADSDAQRKGRDNES